MLLHIKRGTRSLLRGIIAVLILTCGVFVLPKIIEDLSTPRLVYRNLPLPAFRELQDYTQQEYPALVRLESEKSGFFCSGTVISDDYVLTAAHCLMHEGLFPGMTAEPIKIVSIGAKAIVMASAAAVNNRADYALVKGDFKKFTKMKIWSHPNAMTLITGPTVTCGFPWGAESTCYVTGERYILSFGQYVTSGVMYPGMSGGPVVDVGARAMFAINAAVGDGFIVVSPLVGLFETLEIQVLP